MIQEVSACEIYFMNMAFTYSNDLTCDARETMIMSIFALFC